MDTLPYHSRFNLSRRGLWGWAPDFLYANIRYTNVKNNRMQTSLSCTASIYTIQSSVKPPLDKTFTLAESGRYSSPSDPCMKTAVFVA